MASEHHFRITVKPDWASTDAAPSPRKNRRRHTIEGRDKPSIGGSAAVGFHGETTRWNPEELFIASLAQCHMLSLLYVVDRDGINLIDYSCEAEGTLELDDEGMGKMATVTIRPRTVTPSADAPRMQEALREAHELCFIARSVNCEVLVEPEVVTVSPPDTQA